MNVMGVIHDVRHAWRAIVHMPMLAGAVVALQGVMLLLLLAVCANTANLMLARASSRWREVGMRLTLGAGPWRIVSLLPTENLMLALGGAALGAAIAAWATDALRAVPMLGRFRSGFKRASTGSVSRSPLCLVPSRAFSSAWHRRCSSLASIPTWPSDPERARPAAARCGRP
jgi:cell division protein FtsX